MKKPFLFLALFLALAGFPAVSFASGKANVNLFFGPDLAKRSPSNDYEFDELDFSQHEYTDDQGVGVGVHLDYTPSDWNMALVLDYMEGRTSEDRLENTDSTWVKTDSHGKTREIGIGIRGYQPVGAYFDLFGGIGLGWTTTSSRAEQSIDGGTPVVTRDSDSGLSPWVDFGLQFRKYGWLNFGPSMRLSMAGAEGAGGFFLLFFIGYGR